MFILTIVNGYIYSIKKTGKNWLLTHAKYIFRHEQYC